MSDRPIGATDLTSVHRCLHRITETLALELACPSGSAPDWSGFEWSLAPAVASIHGVSPLLAQGLRWQGPPAWTAFLHAQREHTRLRHVRILELLRRLHEHAIAAGIALVALKGSALHARGIYQPGERPMSDIDLLATDTQGATRVLERLGYRWVLDTEKHGVFEPLNWTRPRNLGEHADNGIKIELHGRILEPLPLRHTDISMRILPRTPRPGVNAYPSTAALMSHLLLHAAGTMAWRSLRLLHLQDIARVAARMSDVDWKELMMPGGPGEELPWWAFPPLALTARYFKAVPADVLAALEPSCPWVLRRILRSRSLTDVSLSSLWISAFPGIEWSRSSRDALDYVRRRVWPDSKLRQARQKAAEVQPELTGAWEQLSQSRRVMKWLTSRPARTETLAAISAALEWGAGSSAAGRAVAGSGSADLLI